MAHTYTHTHTHTHPNIGHFLYTTFFNIYDTWHFSWYDLTWHDTTHEYSEFFPKTKLPLSGEKNKLEAKTSWKFHYIQFHRKQNHTKKVNCKRSIERSKNGICDLLTFGASIDRYSLSILATPHKRWCRVSVGLARERYIRIFPDCHRTLSGQIVQYVRRNCKVQRSWNTERFISKATRALGVVLYVYKRGIYVFYKPTYI